MCSALLSIAEQIDDYPLKYINFICKFPVRTHKLDASPVKSQDFNTISKVYIYIPHLYTMVPESPFRCHKSFSVFSRTLLLSTPIGIDYVVIGFDKEVQPLITHNAASPLCMSVICTDVVSNHLLFGKVP